MEKLSESIKSMGYDILGLSSVVYSIGISAPQACGQDGCDGGCSPGCYTCSPKCSAGGIGLDTNPQEE